MAAEARARASSDERDRAWCKAKARRAPARSGGMSLRALKFWGSSRDNVRAKSEGDVRGSPQRRRRGRSFDAAEDSPRRRSRTHSRNSVDSEDYDPSENVPITVLIVLKVSIGLFVFVWCGRRFVVRTSTRHPVLTTHPTAPPGPPLRLPARLARLVAAVRDHPPLGPLAPLRSVPPAGDEQTAVFTRTTFGYPSGICPPLALHHGCRSSTSQ